MPIPTVEPGHGYPRPQLVRDEWISLDGTWELGIDVAARWGPHEARFDRTIVVPFSPETPASTVHDTSFYKAVWYRRDVAVPDLSGDQRLHLHFGAVDYQAKVWVDGHFVAEHEGGYTPFCVDITEEVRGHATVVLMVRAYDDPADLAKPRGKQDWKLEPHSIWYPRTTGIWQTVWMERVAATRIDYLRWTPNLGRWELGLQARVVTPCSRNLVLEVELSVGNTLLVHDNYVVLGGEVHRRIALSDPGIDDFRNELLWTPHQPTLIDARLTLLDEAGAVLDRVESYTAIRSISIQGDRIELNGRAYPLRLILDQGYWPDTGLTPPDDAALRRDVELTKAMGFNGARKHQKIEDPRYLYWADVLGLLVWEEMPSAYRFTQRSVERLAKQWIDAIMRDVSHPCIIAWVPFNESWGVPNLPDNAAERHYVQALYHLTKTLDPTRPVIGNDGWESVATDIVGIHDYDARPERVATRYEDHEDLPQLLERERPGGRLLMLTEHAADLHPVVLSEFGGIAMAREGTWGYSICRTPEELRLRYARLLQVVASRELLAGFCYTQFADTYQEANGLLYADRTPKFPLADMARATEGGLTPEDLEGEVPHGE